MRNGLQNEVPDTITKPAVAASVPLLVEFVSAQAWECGFQDESIKKIVLAVEEAFGNILHFACNKGKGEITISCSIHSSGALVINIADTGNPFNMLLSSTFPEAEDFTEPGQIPSTKLMKKIIKNIEYERKAEKNTLIFVVSKDVL